MILGNSSVNTQIELSGFFKKILLMENKSRNDIHCFIPFISYSYLCGFCHNVLPNALWLSIGLFIQGFSLI